MVDVPVRRGQITQIVLGDDELIVGTPMRSVARCRSMAASFCWSERTRMTTGYSGAWPSLRDRFEQMWICANEEMMRSALRLTKNHGPCSGDFAAVATGPSRPEGFAVKATTSGPDGPALSARSGRL